MGVFDPLTFTRASKKWAFNSAGVLTEYGNNVPVIDHDPATLGRLGYFVEAARMNGIRNNKMVGAVAGTPGTLPTNWGQGAFGAGISYQVSNVGAEDGIDYIDFRAYGTASATIYPAIFYETVSGVPALTGQTWTQSLFMKLVAGSLSGINVNCGIYEYNSSGGFVSNQAVTVSAPTAASLRSQRIARTFTLSGGASVAFVRPMQFFTITSGMTVDFTIRIGLPQLEQGAYVSSPILTTGVAAMRVADNLWMPSSSWLGAEMTILAWSRINRVNSGGSAIVWEVGNIAGTSRITEYIPSTNTSASMADIAGVSAGVLTALLTQPAGTVRRVATAASAAGRRVSGNGGTVTGNANPVATTFAERLGIGTRTTNSIQLDGYIQRIICIPKFLTDAELRQLSGSLT